jgi:hypothetical protein
LKHWPLLSHFSKSENKLQCLNLESLSDFVG